MPRTHYDERLLEAARGDDRESILSLLVLAQPDLRRYAAQACATSDDVNDAVQEALWILYRRVGTLRTVASFSDWLFAIIRRESSRLARKVLGVKTGIDEIENDSRFSQRPQLELSMDLARALESSPEHYRKIVLLRDVEELTITEIVIELGRTREAVKRNLHRARLLLREYLCSRSNLYFERLSVMPQGCSLPFASKSAAEHVLRGVLGAMAILVAIKLGDTNPIASVGLGVLALVSFRGCPMCWVAGMLGTLQQRVTY